MMEHISAPVARVMDGMHAPSPEPPRPAGRMPTTLAIAVHECGHAIARFGLVERFRIPAPHIRGISIVADSEWLGRVEMDSRVWTSVARHLPRTPEHLRGIRLDIIETLAGPLAEIRWRSRSYAAGYLMRRDAVSDILGPDSANEGDWFDVEVRMGCLMAGSAADPRAVLLRLWEAAWTLVEIEWPRIQFVARQLVERPEMDGEALKDAWRGAPGNRARHLKRMEALHPEGVAALAWAAGLEESP